MTEALAFDPQRFMEHVRRVGHGGALGIFYRDHGEDWVELGLPYSNALVGMPESGILASGPIISLMDMATSLAIWVRLGRFRHQATLDMRVDYLRPAAPFSAAANAMPSPAASASSAAPPMTATPPTRSPMSAALSCSLTEFGSADRRSGDSIPIRDG